MIELDDRDFQRGLVDALNDFEKEAWAQERNRAERIQASARRYAPKDTGAGAADVEVTEGTDEEGRFVEVGTDTDYMLDQEFGTSKMPAHPFMRPAIEENVD